MTDTNNTQATGIKNYFNLHTTGIGYISRIREVKPKQGQPFWACTIGALRGSEDNVEYTYYDCRVSGSEAINLIKRCKMTIDEGIKTAKEQAQAEGKTPEEIAQIKGPKILVGFNIGDTYPELFDYKEGKNAGKKGVSLKGRLLYISFIMKDGVEVYKAKNDKDEEGANNAEANSDVPSNNADAVPTVQEQVQHEPKPEIQSQPQPTVEVAEKEIVGAF